MSASGWAGPRSHSRGPGPRALSRTAAGSGQRAAHSCGASLGAGAPPGRGLCPPWASPSAVPAPYRVGPSGSPAPAAVPSPPDPAAPPEAYGGSLTRAGPAPWPSPWPLPCPSSGSVRPPPANRRAQAPSPFPLRGPVSRGSRGGGGTIPEAWVPALSGKGPPDAYACAPAASPGAAWGTPPPICRISCPGPATGALGTAPAPGTEPTGDDGPAAPASRDRRSRPSPSGVVGSASGGVGGACCAAPPVAPAGPAASSRRAVSPSRSVAPGRKRTGRPPTGAPSRVVPLVESRSVTVTAPPSVTVTAQCSRETSGSSKGTSASAERPSRTLPPWRRWMPPASGPATTCSRALAEPYAVSAVTAAPCAGSAAGATGACSETRAPSSRGGSPMICRCGSSRRVPA
ncbi:hypothetical protein STAL104432_30430 [Streptomyces albus]